MALWIGGGSWPSWSSSSEARGSTSTSSRRTHLRSSASRSATRRPPPRRRDRRLRPLGRLRDDRRRCCDVRCLLRRLQRRRPPAAESAVDGTWTATPESVPRLPGEGDAVRPGHRGCRANQRRHRDAVAGRHQRRVGRVHGRHDHGPERLRQPGQPVHGRIMDTDTYPTSTFTLTQPIERGRSPPRARPSRPRPPVTSPRGDHQARHLRRAGPPEPGEHRGGRLHPDRLRRLGHPQPELRAGDDGGQRAPRVPVGLQPELRQDPVRARGSHGPRGPGARGRRGIESTAFVTTPTPPAGCRRT